MYNDNTETQTSESEYNTKYDVSMFKEIKASDIKKLTKGKLVILLASLLQVSTYVLMANLHKVQASRQQ